MSYDDWQRPNLIDIQRDTPWPMILMIHHPRLALRVGRAHSNLSSCCLWLNFCFLASWMTCIFIPCLVNHKGGISVIYHSLRLWSEMWKCYIYIYIITHIYIIYIYTTLTPQIKGNSKDIFQIYPVAMVPTGIYQDISHCHGYNRDISWYIPSP